MTQKDGKKTTATIKALFTAARASYEQKNYLKCVESLARALDSKHLCEKDHETIHELADKAANELPENDVTADVVLCRIYLRRGQDEDAVAYLMHVRDTIVKGGVMAVWAHKYFIECTEALLRSPKKLEFFTEEEIKKLSTEIEIVRKAQSIAMRGPGFGMTN